VIVLHVVQKNFAESRIRFWLEGGGFGGGKARRYEAGFWRSDWECFGGGGWEDVEEEEFGVFGEEREVFGCEGGGGGFVEEGRFDFGEGEEHDVFDRVGGGQCSVGHGAVIVGVVVIVLHDIDKGSDLAGVRPG